MNDSATFELVFEAPAIKSPENWPWPVAAIQPYTFIAISRNSDDLEIGLFIAQLADYNQLEGERSIQAILDGLIKAESLILCGGVGVFLENSAIHPGCCCGLEEWREWFADVLFSGGPWWGHDPTPWTERTGETVRFYSDGGFGRTKTEKIIEVTTERVQEEAARLELEFNGFLDRIRNWAYSLEYRNTERLILKLDQAFQISAPPRFRESE